MLMIINWKLKFEYCNSNSDEVSVGCDSNVDTESKVNLYWCFR